MPIYHYQVKIISRSRGRSAQAAAAYRAGERLQNRETGEIHDYTRKRGIDHTEIMAPDGASAWVYDREELWNRVEAAEKRKDAQLAREVIVGLPVELTKEERMHLLRGFVEEQFVARGMMADVSIHGSNSNNPHAHLLLTTRGLTKDGFGNKERQWNEKTVLQEQREAWALHVNQALERAGHDLRVDHRTLAEQGIDRVPTIHVGVAAEAMEREGIETERGKRRDLIEEVNDYLAVHKEVEQHYNHDTTPLFIYLRAQHVTRLEVKLTSAVETLPLGVWTLDQVERSGGWFADKVLEGYTVTVNPVGDRQQVYALDIGNSLRQETNATVVQLREFCAAQFELALVADDSVAIYGTWTIADIENHLGWIREQEREGYQILVRPLEEGMYRDECEGFVPLVIEPEPTPYQRDRDRATIRYAEEIQKLQRRYGKRFDADRADWVTVKKLALEGYREEELKEAMREASYDLHGRKQDIAEYYVHRTVERALTLKALEKTQEHAL